MTHFFLQASFYIEFGFSFHNGGPSLTCHKSLEVDPEIRGCFYSVQDMGTFL